MEDYIVIGVLIWLLAAAYLVWRILRCVKRRISEVPELSWLIYLIVFTLAAPLIYVASRWGREAALAAAVVTFIISFFLSYRANGRYRKWLKEQEKKENEQ